MTREEAAKILYNQWQGFLEDNIDYAGISDAYKMAIKALEQEPCSNCCNGNQIEQAKLCQKSYLAGMKHKQESKWIPVSERLPEDNDYHPYTNPNWNDNGAILWCTNKGIVGIGWYYDFTKAWANLDDEWIEDNGEVIAWMPLPEPYKAESEDKE